MPVPGKTGFFRVTGLGIRLAEALDERLRSNEEIYSLLLATLAPVTASKEHAIALWQIWAPDQILEAERVAFQQALFSADEIGNRNGLLGKRSATLALAIHHLHHCTSPAHVGEIRQGMALSVAPDGLSYDVPESLIPTRNGWLTLQMRQLQRLSMECMLSWCEDRILADRINETSAMAECFKAGWDGVENGFGKLTSVDEMIVLLDCKAESIEGFITAINEGRIENPFDLMATIQQLFRARDPSFVHPAFLGVLICVAYAGAAAKETSSLQLGGVQRLSLESLRRRMNGLGVVSVREAFQYILEAMIISQHFSTAVNRFDGQNQRLRLTIEETGLEVLVGKPWEPTVTEDRLPTLLSLAAQSGIVAGNDPNGFSAS